MSGIKNVRTYKCLALLSSFEIMVTFKIMAIFKNESGLYKIMCCDHFHNFDQFSLHFRIILDVRDSHFSIIFFFFFQKPAVNFLETLNKYSVF